VWHVRIDIQVYIGLLLAAWWLDLEARCQKIYLRLCFICFRASFKLKRAGNFLDWLPTLPTL